MERSISSYICIYIFAGFEKYDGMKQVEWERASRSQPERKRKRTLGMAALAIGSIVQYCQLVPST